MKQHIIRSGKTPALHLFFAGWGMDHRPFTCLANDQEDLMICYDYTDMTFDYSLLAGYGQIRLSAWSMGVWAAAVTFQNKAIIFRSRTAINGTHTPVHDTCGIPISIFEGTLHSLNEKNLERFNRRMCNSDKALITLFQSHAPQRSIESLQDELAAIGSLARNPPPVFDWDKIIAGENDLIFPLQNQLNAWSGKENRVILPIAHYTPFHSLHL